MIKILAIGNSFSQDATHYLHQIGAADNIDLKVVNLYIGGCSLERHWNNIQSEAEEYLYEENGYSTEEYISVQKALDMEDWDYIVTQQVSQDAGIIETYCPYIEYIAHYLKEKAPKAELLLQETWAYEIDSLHSGFYLLAATWYKTLIGNSIINNSYIPFTELAPNAICDAQVLKVVKETVEANDDLDIQ